ncbi:hypothetical protein ACHWQZ_G002272 [Mnemiopsis leidyi]
MPYYYDFSNKTLFGIQNNAERLSWAGYYIFVVLSSFLGSTTILVASSKYKAFKLHKLVVIVIQHIAVCDLVTSLSFYLSKTVALLADGWILGSGLCNLQYYTRHYITATGAYLICALTATKMLILRYPLRAGSLTARTAHVGCLTIWVCIMIVPIIFIIDDSGITFDYRIFDCMYDFSSRTWQWCKPILVLLFLIFPAITVVVTTFYLLTMAKRIAKRDRKTLKWQGLTTTILTASVYCVSVLPSFLIAMTSSISESLSSSSELYFYRISVSCLTLNAISNFYIYCLTLPSFRAFLLTRLRILLLSFTPSKQGSSHIERRCKIDSIRNKSEL